jgi:hypothetical protein
LGPVAQPHLVLAALDPQALDARRRRDLGRRQRLTPTALISVSLILQQLLTVRYPLLLKLQIEDTGLLGRALGTAVPIGAPIGFQLQPVFRRFALLQSAVRRLWLLRPQRKADDAPNSGASERA